MWRVVLFRCELICFTCAATNTVKASIHYTPTTPLHCLRSLWDMRLENIEGWLSPKVIMNFYWSDAFWYFNSILNLLCRIQKGLGEPSWNKNLLGNKDPLREKGLWPHYHIYIYFSTFFLHIFKYLLFTVVALMYLVFHYMVLVFLWSPVWSLSPPAESSIYLVLLHYYFLIFQTYSAKCYSSATSTCTYTQSLRLRQICD